MLRFRYMEVPSRARFVPAVPMWIVTPKDRIIVDVLVDTGASIVELPIRLADRLGVSLSAVPQGSLRSSSGHQTAYFTGTVNLELRDGFSAVTWSAQVAFTENPARNLFGYVGGLEFFHAHFLGPEGRLLLDPRPGLPIPQ